MCFLEEIDGFCYELSCCTLCVRKYILLKWVSKSIQDTNKIEAIEVLVDGFYSSSIDIHLMDSKSIKLILFINPS